MNKLIALVGSSGAAMAQVIAAPAMADNCASTGIQSNTGNEASENQTGSIFSQRRCRAVPKRAQAF